MFRYFTIFLAILWIYTYAVYADDALEINNNRSPQVFKVLSGSQKTNSYDIIYTGNLVLLSPKNSKSSIWHMDFVSSGANIIQINKKYNNSGTMLANTVSDKNTHIYQKCSTINGGYFGIAGSSGARYFQPSGPIIFANKVLSELDDSYNIWGSINTSIITGKDQNLREYVSIGRNKFWSGPKIISGGLVLDNIKNNISHWTGKHYRTFVVYHDNVVTMDISIQKISLWDLGQKIKSIGLFGNKFDVINLDGGSSTALYTPIYQFNHGKSKLPRFFTICDGYQSPKKNKYTKSSYKN